MKPPKGFLTAECAEAQRNAERFRGFIGVLESLISIVLVLVLD